MSVSVVVRELPPCDFCKAQGVTQPARFDGKTVNGMWAYMCGGHFILVGTGVGTGIGQRLILKGEQ